jgi:hypothetical protein
MTSKDPKTQGVDIEIAESKPPRHWIWGPILQLASCCILDNSDVGCTAGTPAICDNFFAAFGCSEKKPVDDSGVEVFSLKPNGFSSMLKTEPEGGKYSRFDFLPDGIAVKQYGRSRAE